MRLGGWVVGLVTVSKITNFFLGGKDGQKKIFLGWERRTEIEWQKIGIKVIAKIMGICYARFLKGKMREIPLLLGFQYSCATANNLIFVTPQPKKIKYYLIQKFSPLVQNTELQFTVSCTLSPYHYF